MGIAPNSGVPSGMGIFPANDGTSVASGMAAFFARDEEDWKNLSVRNPMAATFDPLGEFMTEFKSWIDAIVQAFGMNFAPLISKIQDVVDDVINPDWLSDVSGWSALIDGISANFDELRDALNGTYSGSDPALNAIQQIARGFRSVLSGGPLINLGQLTTAPVNLLPSGAFDTEGTVAEGEGWSWDDTIGRTAPGSARFDATGDAGLLFSPGPAEVEPGKQYTSRCWVRWDGVTATGVAFSPFVRWSDAGGGMLSESPLPTVTDPSSASGTWVELSGGVTAPAGARWAHLVFQVESGVLGSVWWDDAGILAAQSSLPQTIIDGLADALDSLGDWIESLVDQLLAALGIPALGTLWDKINDLSDEVEGWFGDTQDRAAELADLIGDLLADPASVIGTIPQALVGGLEATLNQIEDVFNGLVVTPVNSVVGAISDWFNQWFGGGSTNAIPMSMRGAANGVAPLNGSTKLPTSYLVTDTANNVPTLDSAGKIKAAQVPDLSGSFLPVGSRGATNGVAPLNASAVVPLANLPAEVGGTGGEGGGLPWVSLYNPAAAGTTVPNNTLTTVSGWAQRGTVSVTFEDSTNTRWRMPLPGIWAFNVFVEYNTTNTTGYRYVALNRLVSYQGETGPPQTVDGVVADDSVMSSSLYSHEGVQGRGTSHVTSSQVVANFTHDLLYHYTFTSNDYFSVKVRHTMGSSTTLSGGVPGTSGTYVLATYMGAV